ncbi:hypothetical protein MJO28_009910 [Puccinia striiformis f. sp. tritici]|uniref:Uncharacterized protein n=1 Tax=Puccinia striiformis f. sp. tritici TaxID=168172 RepID=A0ACC0E9Q6_9BASI|nr:hypothetical protein Pst134EA_017255 [Puccinia striiformis f. sp. tritici]KAH9460946.1 hypothetical protein Pst134EA_017255 [Puccinia striiformis f. sp. tritici]KAI7948002.1 hypothetical protein MJO28_009910 [Puccinia striiformis f. sp. tritici]KAI7951006.1 hypothetical protein MJO29_009680 [Puccinia striiformis f. sp. tritici]
MSSSTPTPSATATSSAILPPPSTPASSSFPYFTSSSTRSSTATTQSQLMANSQHQSSNLSIDIPVATSSVVNKAASRSASLYQNCLETRALLRRVPGFEEGPWITETKNPNSLLDDSPTDPNAPHSKHTSNPLDPVTQTLEIFRLGSPLCYLYNNILNPPLTQPELDSLPPLPPGKTWSNLKPLKVLWCPREDLKGCQKSAAHFIMALKTELGWGTEIDEIQENGLMVNMLYDVNTNATVKVISNVLRLLHLLKALGVLLPPSEDELVPQGTNVAMDDRARVVKEILESERKYVQDLEVLQNYQRALLQREILPSDQIRALFINLDSLVDFQRRFLIGVEANARLPPEEQRFGHLFHSFEDSFSCYEPFCANFASASQLAQDENAALTKVADILDPNYELPTFLIKPVQRICKYPLLLQQLVKNTTPGGPYYDELKEGLASITRVTDAVNETTRQRENELAVNDLKERVEDWKGHDLVTFGALVLEDTFTVVKNDSEREYHVYLFERIILCCKEVGIKLDKKASKQSMSLKKNSQINNSNANGGKRKNTQQLKGRIFIANVMSATPRPVPPGSPHQHQNLLQVTWRGDISEEYFSIKCRTEEQLKKWQAAITKAVDDAVERRRRQVHHLSSGSRSKMNSPLSQFPNTPQTEMGQAPNSASYAHHPIQHPPRIPEHPYAHSGHGNRGGSVSSRTFEDEEDSYQTDGESSANGRNTPSGSRKTTGHRSMPAERSEASFGPGRARAQTDDAASANLAQWRNQMPNSSIPPVPRSGQLTPASSDAYMTNSLRSSTSSKPLRHQPSHEWGGSGTINGGPSSSSSGFYRSDDPSRSHLPHSSTSGHPSVLYPNRHPGVDPLLLQSGHTNPSSHPHPPSQNSSSSTGVPMFRSRSASSPNIHQLPDFSAHQQWNQTGHHSSNGVPSVPSLPSSSSTTHHPTRAVMSMQTPVHLHHQQHQHHRMGHVKQKSSDSSATGMTDRSSLDSQRLSTGPNSTTIMGGSRSNTSHSNNHPPPPPAPQSGHQRFSSGHVHHPSGTGSSLLTSRSSGSLVVVQGGAGAGNESNASAVRYPINTDNGALLPSSSSSVVGTVANGPTSIRFKLKAGEDTYVIVTLSTVTYQELIAKILKKLKNCGVASSKDPAHSISSSSGGSAGYAGKIKIRYEDEEGDLILICNDEDVGMAIDWMKSVGISHLMLFVD